MTNGFHTTNKAATSCAESRPPAISRTIAAAK